MFNSFFKETRIFGEEGRERCCRVRREEERTKKGEIEKEEKQLLDFRSSQENQKSKKTFGAWIRVWLEKSHPLFIFLAFTQLSCIQTHIYIYIYNLCIHTYFSTKIISLCIYIYIYIYIYPYLYKVISITLKEHICSIISHASYIVETPITIYIYIYISHNLTT